MTRRENIIRAITRNGPEWIPYRYDGSLTLLKPAVTVRPVEGGRDDWGANWLRTNEREGSYPDSTPIALIDGVDELRAPVTDFTTVTGGLRKQVSGLAREDTLVLAYNELTLFERAELILGTEAFLMATALNPEATGRLLDVIAGYQEKLTESLMKSGVSGVRFTDDWGTQSALFISPGQWRRLIKPRLGRLYAIVKGHGGFVFQHSCGHIEEIVPDLIEIGLDVLDPCQPAANDVFRLKRLYGDRLCFMGGLDTQGYLSFGDPQTVKRRVREFVSVMGAGGGYIAAPSHTITIPEENRRAMLEALNEVGRY